MNKFLITPVKLRFATLGVRQSDLAKWAADWRFFFILGFGRSGTSFMANILDQAPGAHVYHEPVLEDFYSHLWAHNNPQAAEKYMQGFRKREIYLRTRAFAPGVYGEVNGVLRCHAEAIRTAFPHVTLIHLVRDGRDVIRSLMSRRVMTWGDLSSINIRPTKGDPWRTRWDNMDRFSRLCWYWQTENAYLRDKIGRTVQFERILSSYEYFSSKVLEPCHIQVSQTAWSIAIARPRNTTEHFLMPKWENWPKAYQDVFRQICGDEMAKCGYTF